jgi:hypothetical protein
MLRGTAQLQEIEGIVPEYALASTRYMGAEQGRGWIAQAEKMFPKMVRISIAPAWVGVIDFQERFPSPIESAMR